MAYTLNKLEIKMLKDIAKAGDTGLAIESKRGNYTRVNRALALESDGYIISRRESHRFEMGRKFYTITEEGKTFIESLTSKEPAAPETDEMADIEGDVLIGEPAKEISFIAVTKCEICNDGKRNAYLECPICGKSPVDMGRYLVKLLCNNAYSVGERGGNESQFRENKNDVLNYIDGKDATIAALEEKVAQLERALNANVVTTNILLDLLARRSSPQLNEHLGDVLTNVKFAIKNATQVLGTIKGIDIFDHAEIAARQADDNETRNAGQGIYF